MKKSFKKLIKLASQPLKSSKGTKPSPDSSSGKKTRQHNPAYRITYLLSGDNYLKKTIIFRIYSFTLTLIAARVWYGDWHMTPFAIFLIPYCTVIYYIFEIVWNNHNPHSKIGG